MMSSKTSSLFNKFEFYINQIDDFPAKSLDEITVENWAVKMFLAGFAGEFVDDYDWRTAQLLNYMVAYWRRMNEEKEERGFPGFPLGDFLTDYNIAEYTDIVPYSKHTLAEIIALGIAELTAELVAAVGTVAADRRAQLDHSSATFYKWVTAGDARVCGNCKSHEGEIIGRTELMRESNQWEYNASMGEVHSSEIPPIHPRCRCKLVPVTLY